jgi:hypothetical protein
VQRFWSKLSNRVLASKFDLHIEERTLWIETWKAAAGGAMGPIKILPIAYLRLPAVTNLSPPPIIIINVLIQVIKSIDLHQTSKSDHKDTLPAVNILEAVLDIVSLRLGNLIKGSYLSNKDHLMEAIQGLEKTLLPAISKSISLYPNDSERLARLILRHSKEITELKNKIEEFSLNQRQNLEIDVRENIQKPAWLGWQQNPTLDWLMSDSWHMVDDLKATYSSSEEYTETLLKLWTLLTFYWGAGAVWPRCTHKQGSDPSSDMNVCGEPLLTVAYSGLCKKSGCNGNAVWKCFRNNHDHICKKCLQRGQDALVGAPGTQASTDIYDAIIEREVTRREEIVYLLKNVNSRKPPKIAPNWKTSKF